MNPKRSVLLILLFAGLSIFLQAQEKRAVLLDFNYSYGIPIADLSDRYGNHLSLGTGISLQPAGRFLLLGAGAEYWFGSTVKEDVLVPLRSSFGGLLLGNDEYLTEFKQRQRGWLFQAYAGSVLPIGSQKKARQSLKLQLGAGFLQHQIRFLDEARSLPQFTKSYKKGFDRLANGWALIPFAGYEFLSRKGWLSFYAGVESVLAFTQNQRNFNYDSNRSEFGDRRFDAAIQFKLGLYLPFYLDIDQSTIEY
ncbi:MAG TPA: hypothetical protein VFX48_03730 [Saprospiraceae bacterium]|nr:hypothetical protein [Saprospiraceae bacterium]